MTRDADDAMRWEGDDDGRKSAPALPDGWNAVGKGSDEVGHIEKDGTVTSPHSAESLSTPMLIALGVIGGIYLLYTVGWAIGGMNLQGKALFLIPGVMYHSGLWAAVLAPALWFLAAWVLTRRSAAWMRLLALFAGVVLLVPWPFVMTGAVGP